MAQIVDPAPGRPAFVEPGGILRVIIAEDLPAPVRCVLIADSTDRATIPLLPDADAASGSGFRLHIPPHVPTGVYSLRIEGGTTRLESTSCVSVCHITNDLRVLQIPGPAIGDLLHPTLDWKLNEEINLLAPDVVVICGNYVDPLHEDVDTAWREFTEWLRRLEVPVIAAFGPRDDITAFSKHLAPGPVGCATVGQFSFITINDSAAAPLNQDENQINWLRTILHSRSATTRFLLSDNINSFTAKAIDKILESAEAPAVPIMWIADHELSDRIGVGDAVRDHPQRQKNSLASIQTIVLTPSRNNDRKTLNILECSQNPNSNATDRQSIRKEVYEAGSLAIRRDAAADAPQASAAATIWNYSNSARQNLRLRLQIKKVSDEHPWIIGGQLVQLADHGAFWNCTIQFDVAPRSRTRVVAGVESQPAYAALRVEIHTRSQSDATAPHNANAPRGFGSVRITNDSNESIALRPEMRIDQQPVRYGVANISAAPAWGYEISLDANESADLVIDYTNLSCPPTTHRHRLQVFAAGKLTAEPEIAEIPCARFTTPRANSATFDALRNLYGQSAIVPTSTETAPIPFRVHVANPR